MAKGFRPSKAPAPAAAAVRLAKTDPFADLYPATWGYLTALTWPDGSPRETASVTVFLQEGLLKVCCRDRANGRICFAAAEGWEGLWLALEAALAADKADWRADKAPGTRKKA